jgi:hypothetical protein
MDTIKVKWLDISAYYDMPLEGWLKLEGGKEYYYFQHALAPEDDIDREYGVRTGIYYIYKCTDREVYSHYIKSMRDFRRMVSWGWSYDPQKGGTNYHTPKNGYKKYYEKYDPTKESMRKRLMEVIIPIGSSLYLEEVTLF